MYSFLPSHSQSPQALEFDLQVFHPHNVVDVFITEINNKYGQASDWKHYARNLVKKCLCSNMCLCFSPPVVALAVLRKCSPHDDTVVNSYITTKFGDNATTLLELSNQASYFIPEVSRL